MSARIPLLPLIGLAAGLAAAAVPDNTRNENKTVTFAHSSADGGSDISREKTQDCIQSLPDPDKLDAIVASQPVFAEDLNGTGAKKWIKSYTATLDVTYLTREKELLIVTTRSVQGQAPVMKEIDKVLRHTQSFASNPTEGDAYAGRSDREYYFTKSELAIADVKARARVWVAQQKAAVCPDK